MVSAVGALAGDCLGALDMSIPDSGEKRRGGISSKSTRSEFKPPIPATKGPPYDLGGVGDSEEPDESVVSCAAELAAVRSWRSRVSVLLMSTPEGTFSRFCQFHCSIRYVESRELNSGATPPREDGIVESGVGARIAVLAS